jgi:hypothetical protein
MTKSPRFKQLSLIFEKREDGGLRVWSHELPGFVLSHSDCEAVWGDIKPALETILSEMFSARVTVAPVEGLREDLEDVGMLPIYPGGSMRRDYVVEVNA